MEGGLTDKLSLEGKKMLQSKPIESMNDILVVCRKRKANHHLSVAVGLVWRLTETDRQTE
eukprot:10288639-Prorocentrum_lima.AAC.1